MGWLVGNWLQLGENVDGGGGDGGDAVEVTLYMCIPYISALISSCLADK